jgi:hypothetical protein
MGVMVVESKFGMEGAGFIYSARMMTNQLPTVEHWLLAQVPMKGQFGQKSHAETYVGIALHSPRREN